MGYEKWQGRYQQGKYSIKRQRKQAEFGSGL
jgi:hypothetical protein